MVTGYKVQRQRCGSLLPVTTTPRSVSCIHKCQRQFNKSDWTKLNHVEVY